MLLRNRANPCEPEAAWNLPALQGGVVEYRYQASSGAAFLVGRGLHDADLSSSPRRRHWRAGQLLVELVQGFDVLGGGTCGKLIDTLRAGGIRGRSAEQTMQERDRGRRPPARRGCR